MSKTDALVKPEDCEGGLYWIVVDGTPEKELALRYAAHRAKANNARIALIHIVREPMFQPWGNVQDKIKDEQRKEVEEIMWSAANLVYELGGGVCSMHLAQGDRVEEIITMLNDNPASKMFILASSSKKNPGPLIKYFTTKGIGRMTVPLVILPQGLAPEDIDYLGQ